MAVVVATNRATVGVVVAGTKSLTFLTLRGRPALLCTYMENGVAPKRPSSSLSSLLPITLGSIAPKHMPYISIYLIFLVPFLSFPSVSTQSVESKAYCHPPNVCFIRSITPQCSLTTRFRRSPCILHALFIPQGSSTVTLVSVISRFGWFSCSHRFRALSLLRSSALLYWLYLNTTSLNCASPSLHCSSPFCLSHSVLLLALISCALYQLNVSPLRRAHNYLSANGSIGKVIIMSTTKG